MFFITLPSLPQTAIYAGVLYCTYHIYWELTTGAPRRRLSRANGCQPVAQNLSKDPLLGLDFLYTNIKASGAHKVLELRQHAFTATGTNTVKATILNNQTIGTIEPENIKTILSLNFKSWIIPEARHKWFKPLLSDGIFVSNGEAWQHSRDLLRPSFVRSQVSDLTMFESHMAHLIQAIPRDGSTVDLQELFFRLTLDIITEFTLNQSVDSLAPGGYTGSNKIFVEAFGYCQKYLGGDGDLGLWGTVIPDRRYKREAKRVHAFVDELIEKSLTNLSSHKTSPQPSRYIFLHALASQTPDKLKIRAELLNIIIAGRDSTAALLSNIWFSLSQRPDIYARLQTEVDPLDNQPPTADELKNMKYLRALINESLRLYPIVPENAREAVTDTILPLGGGPDGKAPVVVQKGQLCWYNTYVMHRRTDLFGEDATEFRPERWLDEGDRKGLRVGWEFLPFNGGPRICIGQQFALMEVSYVTVRLMQEFCALESRDPEPWREKFSLVCTGFGGCKVGLTPWE